MCVLYFGSGVHLSIASCVSLCIASCVMQCIAKMHHFIHKCCMTLHSQLCMCVSALLVVCNSALIEVCVCVCVCAYVCQHCYLCSVHCKDVCPPLQKWCVPLHIQLCVPQHCIGAFLAFA